MTGLDTGSHIHLPQHTHLPWNYGCEQMLKKDIGFLHFQNPKTNNTPTGSLRQCAMDCRLTKRPHSTYTHTRFSFKADIHDFRGRFAASAQMKITFFQDVIRLPAIFCFVLRLQTFWGKCT